MAEYNSCIFMPIVFPHHEMVNQDETEKVNK
jgi:hypothetical protein